MKSNFLKHVESFWIECRSAKFMFCALLLALGLVLAVLLLVNPAGIQSRLFQHVFAPRGLVIM